MDESDSMSGGKAHGPNRQYQIECRDVLECRNPELKPWAADGVDVAFDLPDTRWTFDVALRDGAGTLVVAECRRTAGAVKQEDVAAFGYKVELLRKCLNIPVAGIFITKKGHQLGAIKVGQFNGIQITVLEEGAAPPGFNITFLRYDQEHERRCRDIVMHVPAGTITVTGWPANLIHGKSSDKPEIP
jgi:hypothetical protein